MKTQVSQQQWNQLAANAHMRIKGAVTGADLAELNAAVTKLLARYPNGFDNPPLYTGQKPVPRAQMPQPTDKAPTVIIPEVGFLAPELLKPLANPFVYRFIESVVGKDFYLNRIWFQMVPPGTGRLSYHKDARGGITLNLLLDDIGPKMGSTCLVPGTHLNTPPPAFCMDNLRVGDPREVDLIGDAGDIVVFSNEAWHARAENLSDKWTRRLFYDVCSRTSRNTLAWTGVVDEAQLAAALAALPPEYRHMLLFDPDGTRELKAIGGSALRRWGVQTSSSNVVLRDIVYQWSVYGRKADNDNHPGFLLPNTTRLVEATPFSAGRYLSHFKPVPTLKNMASYVRRKAAAAMGGGQKSRASAMGE